MWKKVYDFLHIAMWAFIGVFLGGSLWRCYEYHARPELFAVQSAPWYLSILLNGLFTAVIVLVLLVLRRLVKRKLT